MVFRPFFCTIKAELGWGQPGLMRWIRDETSRQCSIDRSTLHTAAHCATSELAAAPLIICNNYQIWISIDLTFNSFPSHYILGVNEGHHINSPWSYLNYFMFIPQDVTWVIWCLFPRELFELKVLPYQNIKVSSTHISDRIQGSGGGAVMTPGLIKHIRCYVWPHFF